MRLSPLARAALIVLLGAAGSLVAFTCHARTQWNVGLETGVCEAGSTLGLAGPVWCNAAHADVLLLRARSSDVGLGPALRIGSAGFDDLRLDAGASLLLPLLDSFPLVLEAGPHLRNLTEPGVYASAFFGLRSLNHYGHYEMATGLVLSAERSFTNGTPSAFWIAARLDGAWLAMPFIFLYNAAR